MTIIHTDAPALHTSRRTLSDVSMRDVNDVGDVEHAVLGAAVGVHLLPVDVACQERDGKIMILDYIMIYFYSCLKPLDDAWERQDLYLCQVETTQLISSFAKNARVCFI